MQTGSDDALAETANPEAAKTDGQMNPETASVAETGLVYKGSMELEYAENFTVDYYEGGYTLLTTTMDGAQFLIVPENGEVPQIEEASGVAASHRGYLSGGVFRDGYV